MQKSLAELLEEAGNSDSAIVICIDGSGSIDPSDYQLLIQAVRSMLSRLPLKSDTSGPDQDVCQVALLQFSQVVETLSPFSNNRTTLYSKLLNAVQPRKGTATAAALEQAKVLLNGAKGLKKYLFMLTDGKPDKPDEARNEAVALMIQHGVKIISIGIGPDINLPLLQDMSWHNCAFTLSTWSALALLLRPEEDTTEFPTKLCVEGRTSKSLRCVITTTTWEEVCIEYSVNNKSQYTGWVVVNSLPKVEILIDGLAPLTTVNLRVLTKRGPHTNKTDWQQATTLKETVDTRIIESESELDTLMKNMRDKVESFSIPEALAESQKGELGKQLKKKAKEMGLKRLNILFLGSAGAGKSSLLGTMAAATSGKFPNYRPTAESPDSVSRDLAKLHYVVNNTNISIWDPWGWNETYEYTPELLTQMLRGALPNGHGIKSPYKHDENPSMVKESPTLRDAVHAVIMLYPALAIDNPGMMKTFCANYQVVQNLGHQTLVLLTKADRADERLQQEKMSLQVFGSDLVQMVHEAFIAKSNVNKGLVLPCIAYQGKCATKETGTEYIALRILTDALEQGISFLTVKLCNMLTTEEEMTDTRKNPKSNRKPRKGSSDEDDDGNDDDDADGDVDDEKEKEKKKKKKKEKKKEKEKEKEKEEEKGPPARSVTKSSIRVSIRRKKGMKQSLMLPDTMEGLMTTANNMLKTNAKQCYIHDPRTPDFADSLSLVSDLDQIANGDVLAFLTEEEVLALFPQDD